MRTTSRDWRSTLLPALIISAIALCGGALLIAQSPHPSDAGFGVQFEPSPSHQWTAGDPDGNTGDSFDDDGESGDAFDTASTGAPAAPAADSGESRLFAQAPDRSSSFASDGHSLRAPPQ